MFEEDEDGVPKLSKEPTRSFASLDGLQMITALSAQSVLGLDGIDYRVRDDGLYEMSPAYTTRLEFGVVINRFDPPIAVFFRPRPGYPDMFYGVDERQDRVVIEIGTRLVEWQKYGQYVDAEPGSTTARRRMSFEYNRAGYTPRWLRELQKAGDQG